MRNLFILVLAGLTLAACSKKPMEVDRISPIKSSSGSTNTDVYAKRRKAGENVPELAGDQIVPIRTYAGQENGYNTGDEIAGAKCTINARDFTANIVTPAKVRLPNYRMQSSTISVRCSKEGYKTRTVDHSVYNKTKNDRLGMGAQAGLLGVLAVVAINAASDDKTHDYKYPVLSVVLIPNAKTARKRKTY